MPEETRGSYFDELARGLASGSISRGKALRLMGAALVGSTLASLGIREAAADDECKPEGKKCRKNKQCCSGTCTEGHCAVARTSNGGTCTSGTQCCSGNCKSGLCVASCIPPSATLCDAFDPFACGDPASGCNCLPEVSGAETYCRSSVTDTLCINSCDCLTGQFCEPFGDESFCVVVC